MKAVNLLPIKVEVFKPVPSEEAWANTLDDHKRYLGLILLVTDGYYHFPSYWDRLTET